LKDLKIFIGFVAIVLIIVGSVVACGSDSDTPNVPGAAGDPYYIGEDLSLDGVTLTGPIDAGSGTLSIIAQSDIVLRTENSGTGADVTRLTISGSVANSSKATATWANVEHAGIRLNGYLDGNNKAITALDYISGTTSNPLNVGTGSTTSHTLNAANDLFVVGDFEVDGTTYLDSNATVAGNIDMTNGQITALDYISGTTGAALNVGTGAATSHSLDNANDLFVIGDAEINGTTYLDGNVTTAGTLTASGTLYLNKSGTPSPAAEGMLYYNATVNCLFVYDGSAWQACWSY